MTFNEAKTFLNEVNFSNHRSMTFKAGVIILVGLTVGYDLIVLKNATRYSINTISNILDNLKKYEFLRNDTLELEKGIEEEDLFIELVLVSLVAAGKIRREKVQISRLPAVVYRFPCLAKIQPLLTVFHPEV